MFHYDITRELVRQRVNDLQRQARKDREAADVARKRRSERQR